LKRRPDHLITGIARRISLALLLTASGMAIADAKDLASYRVGVVVDQDFVTPVPLNVVDPAATAALKSSESLKTPAIFRSCPGVTNTLASRFEAAFDGARSNFLSSVQETFHATVLDHAAVTSPDFGYLVTAFNFNNRNFPIPTFLAMDWAYGKDGALEKARLLNSLVELMQNSIRPDDVDLPAGFVMGDTLRLVPAATPGAKLTLSDAQTHGQTVPASDLVTLAEVRTHFRREFTGYDEQPLARALSAWLQPNCLPDPALTQSARDNAVRQLVVAEDYTPGQVVVSKGTVIDQKIKAVLDQLQQASTAVAAAPARTLPEPPISLAMDRPASEDQVQTPAPAMAPSPAPARPEVVANPPAATGPGTAKSQNWVMTSAAFGMAMVVIGFKRLGFKRRRVLQATPVVVPEVQNIDVQLRPARVLQTELAPQLVQIVRQAFVQELAGQRRDLLQAQQAAAAEVIRLVHRMDELQVAMQERLCTYESQIQKLEAELTARTEENRQLIRLKIQMIRHQVEAESSTKRIEFN
jgi:hypothetical protein